VKYSIVFLIWSAVIFAQNIKLPNNPLEGRIVFEEKGCIKCHAISGYGGDVGPDLIKNQYYGSFLDITSVIWNHIPKMNRMFRKLHQVRPQFTNKEMLNLIGFLYYLHYLGEPGNVSEGRKLLRNKGCIICHSINGNGGKTGPDFSKLRKYASPLFMAQTMWNHFPKMSKKMLIKGRKIPELTGIDIVNISEYIRALSNSNSAIKMTPGNPNKGKLVFKSKGCIKCHSVSAKEEDKAGPSLKKLKLNLSVTEIAALMWNHAQSMSETMKEKSVIWPIFSGSQMADLIAYMYFLDFEDAPGNPQKGEMVFSEKGCDNCHSEDDGIGPNLEKKFKLDSPVTMIKKMWNHASGMEDQILTVNKKWPKLTAEDMRNIYAFLRKNNQQ